MVQTRAGKQTVPQHSDSEPEERNSPRSSKKHDSGDESDVDPAMYRVFQKMMTKMMAEQAKAGLKKSASKSKVKKKPMKKPIKISKQKIQRDSTSEDSESAKEEL